MTLLESAPPPPESSTAESGDATTSLSRPLVIMVTLYFVWGFITVLNDLLIPHLKALFRLSNVQAMLVQFAFFGAYFVMSLPAGRIIHRLGYRRSMTLALLTMGAGLLLFVPAASLPSYGVFLIGLFIAGGGITVLQVAANPYVAARFTSDSCLAPEPRRHAEFARDDDRPARRCGADLSFHGRYRSSPGGVDPTTLHRHRRSLRRLCARDRAVEAA